MPHIYKGNYPIRLSFKLPTSGYTSWYTVASSTQSIQWITKPNNPTILTLKRHSVAYFPHLQTISFNSNCVKITNDFSFIYLAWRRRTYEHVRYEHCHSMDPIFDVWRKRRSYVWKRLKVCSHLASTSKFASLFAFDIDVDTANRYKTHSLFTFSYNCFYYFLKRKDRRWLKVWTGLLRFCIWKQMFLPVSVGPVALLTPMGFACDVTNLVFVQRSLMLKLLFTFVTTDMRDVAQCRWLYNSMTINQMTF